MMRESIDRNQAKRLLEVFDQSDRIHRAVTEILEW